MAPIVYSPATTPVEDGALKKASQLGDEYSIDQLPSSLQGPNYLQTSPYTEKLHLLDLNTLTKPHKLLAQALTIMRPISEQYATTAYKEAFNWQEVVDRLKELSEVEDVNYVFPATSFYVIVFRSRVPKTTDWVKLVEMDAEAHREAVASGWLLKYWFGIPDQDGRNLATCLWRHIDDAKRGGSGKGHAKAMQHVRGYYLEWRVERLRLVVEGGAKGWDIVNWVDQGNVCPSEHP